MKKEIIALALILLTLAGFYYLVTSDLNSIIKTIVVLVLLVACSYALQGLLGIEGEYGLLLVRTKKGLQLIDRIAKTNRALWQFVADLGLVMGFGLSSMLLFKRNADAKTILAGMFCLMLFTQFVLPFATPLVVELIDLPGGEKLGLASGALAQTSGEGNGLLSLFVAFLSFLVFFSFIFGGVALAGALALFLKASTVLLAVALFIYTSLIGVPDGGVLAQEGPGAAPVLPGINLPLLEGVLALAVLLVVHESAHGILARVCKIPLDSAGVVFLGILPFGAFVEPDEKKLQRMDVDSQNRVLVAGSTANLLTASVFFVLFLAFYYGVLALHPSNTIGTSYVEVVGVLENGTAKGFIQPGMKILEWKGVGIKTVEDFKKAVNDTKEGDIIEVVTDKGSFSLRAGKEGKVGVQVLQKTYTFGDYVRELSSTQPLMLFLFNFLGLGFVLNVLVGIVNLLPIPPFDGYRILSLKLGEKKLYGIKIMDAIVALIVGAFLANLLPWLWI